MIERVCFIRTEAPAISQRLPLFFGVSNDARVDVPTPDLGRASIAVQHPGEVAHSFETAVVSLV